MASFDYTSKYSDLPDLFTNELTPHYDLSARMFRKRQGFLDTRMRRQPPRIRCSAMGMLGAHQMAINIGRPHAQGRIPYMYPHRPTTPQFSGTVFPGGVRKVKLCRMYGDKADEYVVLQETATAVDGTFFFDELYPVSGNGEYFFLITGDDGRETKDFLLNSPAAHEIQFGKDQRGVGHPAAHYDTSQDLRTLLAHDQFTGVQSASLNGRAPDQVAPGNWVAPSVNIGAHVDGANNFVAYTLGSGATAVIETGESDVLIHADFVLGDSSFSALSPGIIVRWLNSLNFDLIRFSGLNGLVSLDYVRYSAGTPTTIKQRPLVGHEALVLDRYYPVKILTMGERIYYELNLGGKLWGDYVKGQATHSANTMHGFLINAGQYVDNFKVWTV